MPHLRRRPELRSVGKERHEHHAAHVQRVRRGRLRPLPRGRPGTTKQLTKPLIATDCHCLPSRDAPLPGVQAALHAGLVAMARLGCDVALLAHVSAGIYAGEHKQALLADFEAIAHALEPSTGLPRPSTDLPRPSTGLPRASSGLPQAFHGPPAAFHWPSTALH